MHKTLACVAALTALAACGAPSETPRPVTAPIGEPRAGEASDLARTITVEAQRETGRYAAPCLITPTSVAGVAGPKTLGDFTASFPVGSQLVFEPRYMVDIGALCLHEDGVDKLCTYFYSYETDVYSPEVEALGLVTGDQACRTAEGVGPGVTVADASKIYGAPSFGFNYDNEGREYLSFADASDAFNFTAASAQSSAIAETASTQEPQTTFWPNGEFGGDYRTMSTDDGGGYETTIALPDAVIAEVGVR